MRACESLLVCYVLNSMWQTPLMLAAAWVAVRVVRPVGSKAEHRVWVGALALESVVPAISLLPWQRVAIEWPWHVRAVAARAPEVSVQLSSGSALSALQLPAAVMTALAVAYVLLTSFFTVRMVWQCLRLWSLVRDTVPLAVGAEAASSCAQWSRRFATRGAISLVESDRIFVPVTLGVFRHLVVFPAGMFDRLSHLDLETTIAHEFAHIRRKDFLKNLVYEVVSLSASYHPCLWLTRERIMETREMVCDEMATGDSGKQEYAQSLLRLAALLLRGRPVRVPHAIGVFDANTLERRLMRLTEKKNEIGRLRRVVSLGACLLLGAATAASAVALGLGAEQKSSAENSALSKSIPTSIAPEKMQELVITKVPPVYPPDAKSARIQGTVVLNAVIGTDGHVENLKVVSGPRKLQQSALDAVRQWVYKPYTVNGAPAEVDTKVSVIYALQK